MTYKSKSLALTAIAFILLLTAHSAGKVAEVIGSDYVTTSMSIFLLTIFAGVLALYFYTMHDADRAGEEIEPPPPPPKILSEKVEEVIHTDDRAFLGKMYESGFVAKSNGAQDYYSLDLGSLEAVLLPREQSYQLLLKVKHKELIDSVCMTEKATKHDIVCMCILGNYFK